LIDKPFEALFKFIHVLPGAFSAYNMKALKSSGREDLLMKEYFKSIDDKVSENKITETNISASDAILRVLLPDIIYRIFWPIDPESE
jgi:hypothetical protein